MPRFAPHPERRVAVVTGASSGIGAATAKSLAAAGHPVVLGARRTERLDDLAAEITDAGGEAAAVALDLTDDASIEAFAKEALAAFGPIDVVVSNAGDVYPASALGIDPDDFVRAVQINLTGAHRLVNRLGRQMVEAGHGDLVFVTSDVVVRQRTHMAGYVAAKSGLEGLARAMQMELEGTGVRATMVRPGPSSTEQGTTWSEDTVNEVMPHWSAWGHLRHAGALRPQEIADVITYVVAVPKGTHLTLVEIQPEAPVSENRSYK
ncbi:MAG: SDR family oxidoreductase [Candidatus Microthrix sp.]|nr:SDR family oxidoreductase [Candidatus Microthrix sp.]MBK6439129.1 SDR family oxidoreductase [Candidatus Microthrix sp.]